MMMKKKKRILLQKGKRRRAGLVYIRERERETKWKGEKETERSTFRLAPLVRGRVKRGGGVVRPFLKWFIMHRSRETDCLCDCCGRASSLLRLDAAVCCFSLGKRGKKRYV